jgi:hypothetical protein
VSDANNAVTTTSALPANRSCTALPANAANTARIGNDHLACEPSEAALERRPWRLRLRGEVLNLSDLRSKPERARRQAVSLNHAVPPCRAGR